jgi:membrane AbrB-like protein
MRLHAAFTWIACVTIGALAGWACSRLGTPIPWMLGPLFSVASLRVAGVHIAAPPGGRQVGQWVIGTALGLYFTPQVVREVAGWWPLLALGAVFAIVLGYVSGLALSRLANIDRTTAIFASVPGGAAEMTVLGHRFGARADSVAAAQSMRVVIVVAIIPAVFFQLDLHGSDRYLPGIATFDAAGFALLLAATGLGGLVAQWLRVPNAFVLGSLAIAIPLTAAEVNLSAVPTLASNCAQVLLGCALGARFHPNFRQGASRFIVAVTVSVLGAIVASALFAITIGYLSGLNPATLVLAMAPGGIAEMCITAKGLQLGVPLVTAFQVVRIVVLLLVTGPLFARVRGWRRDSLAPPDDF